MSAVADAARAAYAAGLAVLPPREDGSKRPIGDEWEHYQTTRATVAELDTWYGPRRGLGTVCGRVSGGLEMFEFEGRAVAAGLTRQFREAAVAAGLGELLDRIMTGYLERTPSGGFHLLYRCPTPLGNVKLASRPATADELAADPASKARVLIETRGEGGYTITAPTNGAVHPDGGAWTLEAGGFDTIATITDAERDELHALARAFDTMPAPPPRPQVRTGDGTRPGDEYNGAPDVHERTLALLEAHGWRHVYRRGDGVDLLRRPGKDRSWSATLGNAGPGVLHVFSTSAAPFESERSYAPFSVYAILEHGGDFSAAARALGSSIRVLHTSTPDPEPPTGEADPGELYRTTGALVLADIAPRPPAPRRLGRWDKGHNIAYGRGGIGKGLLLSWDITRLVEDGERVMIVDYEDHPDEWTVRVDALGSAEIRASVLHVSPLDPERWHGKTGPLWEVAPTLRELADDFGATWTVVDSIAPASYGADVNAPGTPQLYGQAIAAIGRPAISIGQVNRAGDLRYPFGSVLWHYQCRGSWSVETPPGGTRGTHILLTDRKGNNHAQAERVQLDIGWWDNLPRRVDERPYTLAAADRIALVLEAGPMTAVDITAALNEAAESEDDKTPQSTVRITLRRGLERNPPRFTVTGTGKSARWGNIE